MKTLQLHFGKRFSLVALLAVAVSVCAEAKQKPRAVTIDAGQIYAGARVGIAAPLSLGRNANDISFPDVASNGWAFAVEGMWMQSSSICLGGELSYQTFPYKDQFWVALNHRGQFDASYNDFSGGLIGRAIMGKRRLKPYAGIGVAAHLLNNALNFKQGEQYEGTTDDMSVSYDYTRFHMGGSFESGVFYKVGQTTYLTVSVRLNIIPSVKERIMTTVDPYSYIEKTVVVNPHGNQNNVVFSVGLHFATRSRVGRR